ncbi:MAG: ABC transporter substrate-binding protein [Proteobacteria bacterium]|nr:ABC transporter substrate-binding protein [Pseudomonadota bacterium]
MIYKIIQNRSKLFLISVGLIISLSGCSKEEKKKEVSTKKANSIEVKTVEETKAPPTASQVQLPENIQWTTNTDYPVYTSPDAVKGGVYHDSISTYPLTFRLYGPNANAGHFVSYKRKWSLWGLIERHPNTREFIPNLATHWAVMDDNQTVYFKLDPDARWSDGKPITADDYLFAYKFLSSKHIKAPYYNTYNEKHYKSVDKIDDYTLRMVKKKPSWRILDEIDMTPLPEHVIELDKDWVKKYNWKPNVVPGPYVLGKSKKGKFVEFHKIKNWWGDNKMKYKNRFNFEKIHLSVISTKEIEFEFFKKGKLDLFGVIDATRWVKQTEFDSVKKGYINKQKILVDTPSGIQGIFLNTKNSILKDRNLRLALMHLLDFETINKKLLYQLSTRLDNYFTVYAPYRDTKIRTWPFDLKAAIQLLDKTEWVGPRTKEGFRTKDGKPLSITVSIGSKAWTKYLAVYRESAIKVGIDLQVKLLDGAALFKSWSEKSHQATILVFGGGAYPGPRQMLHTENVKKNTNNMSQFGTKEIDRLIEIFEFDLDEQKRIDAIFKIEKIVKDNAIIIPFWKNKHTKLLWWRYIKGPRGFVTKTGMDLDLLWYDKKEADLMENNKKKGVSFPRLKVAADPFNLEQH